MPDDFDDTQPPTLDAPSSWDEVTDDYRPHVWTAPWVRRATEACAADTETPGPPSSFSDWVTGAPHHRFDVLGRPLHPTGPKGRAGRWSCPWWGENRCADAIVTRDGADGLELLVVVRSDTGRIALPGGHLDPGETPEQAAERELFEETGISVAFSSSHEVYRGPSRDPRDADHAWYVTAAFHQHLLPGHPAGTAELVASDESRSVAWMPLNDQLFDDLYAGHGAIVAGALARPTA